MNKIGLDALEYAVKAHGMQKRLRSDYPFVIHPIRVGNHLYHLYGDAHLAAAGYLHDVLEDTDKTALDLAEAGFGGWIIDRVIDVTKAEGQPWPLPRDKDSNRLKAADTYDNVTDNLRTGYVPKPQKVVYWREIHDHAKQYIDGELILDLLDNAIKEFE